MNAFRLLNGESLRREHQLVCVAEQLAHALVQEGLKYSVVESCYAESPVKRWLVMTGSSSAGLAINTCECSHDGTPLTQMIETVRILSQAGQFMSQRSLEGLILSGQEEISDSWRVFKVDFLKGRLWIGLSEQLPWSGLAHESVERYARGTKVTLKLDCRLPAITDQSEPLVLREVDVVLRDLGKRGRLRAGAGGSVMIEVMEGEVEQGSATGLADTKLPVRLDLGEVELTIAELAALRPGTVIELAHTGPLHCFLRIGSGEVRRGVLRVKGEMIEVVVG